MGRSSTSAGGADGGELHAANTPSQANAAAALYARRMWLLFLEALGALLILVFIIWWTMFSGRDKGERREDWQNPDAGTPKDDSQ
jgi:hypothetical protein